MEIKSENERLNMQIKSQTIKNLLWRFAERITAQGVTLLVSIILARILEPAQYGLIAMVTVFVTIANVFVSDGFGLALIQKKDADALDYCSVLYFNIAFSLTLYAILFFAAPYIAAFYGEGYEILCPVLRVIGLRLLLTAVNSVQQAYVSKHMIFRKFFWATSIGTVISAIVGIAMAYHGFGVWALVAQYLTNTTVDTLVLGISLHKRPRLLFSFSRLKGMLHFGSRVLLVSLIITGYEEMRALIIGKIYAESDLAFYEKGRQFPKLIVTNVNSAVGSVLFPVMANEQDDLRRVKETARKSIRCASYCMSPLMLGLFAVSETVVRVILTEKWLPCVPFLKMFCIYYLFQPVHSTNMQSIKAIGRGDVYLRLEIVKKVIELIVLLSVMRISVEAIALSMTVLATLFMAVNAYPNKKLIDYSFSEQMKDVFPAVLMATIMLLAVRVVGLLPLPDIPLLLIQVLTGGAVYLTLSHVTNNPEYRYLLSVVRKPASAQ